MNCTSYGEFNLVDNPAVPLRVPSVTRVHGPGNVGYHTPSTANSAFTESLQAKYNPTDGNTRQSGGAGRYLQRGCVWLPRLHQRPLLAQLL